MLGPFHYQAQSALAPTLISPSHSPADCTPATLPLPTHNSPAHSPFYLCINSPEYNKNKTTCTSSQKLKPAPSTDDRITSHYPARPTLEPGQNSDHPTPLTLFHHLCKPQNTTFGIFHLLIKHLKKN